VLASAAAEYVAQLSGRKNMYRLYLGGSALLYAMLAVTTNSNKVTFLVCTLLIRSFYGAGFATVPAYLRDLFGTRPRRFPNFSRRSNHDQQEHGST
jgi:MFS family permease